MRNTTKKREQKFLCSGLLILSPIMSRRLGHRPYNYVTIGFGTKHSVSGQVCLQNKDNFIPKLHQLLLVNFMKKYIYLAERYNL